MLDRSLIVVFACGGLVGCADPPPTSFAPESARVPRASSDRSPADHTNLEALIANEPRCGRLYSGAPYYVFLIDAADVFFDRSELEYSFQLRAISQVFCSQHLGDEFSEWESFPDDGLPVPIAYYDLYPPGCGWYFTLRVRNPSGRIATDGCSISNPATLAPPPPPPPASPATPRTAASPRHAR